MNLAKKLSIIGALASLPLGYGLPVYASVQHTEYKTAVIKVDGHNAESNVPYLVHNGTVFMPLHRVIAALQAMGSNVTYNGHALLIDNLAAESSTLGMTSPNHMTIASGSTTLYEVPTVNTSGSSDTYIPIWYVMRALTQGTSGYAAKWTPGDWQLQNGVAGAPSTVAIQRVMHNTTEVHQLDEHFSLMGKPVHFVDANGDTITAAIGGRTPTADGYGQVVFFFHNHQFVGLDSNVEKTEIRSIHVDSHSRAQFKVTYAHYASNDPMVDPSLPPITVKYVWNGTNVQPEGNAQFPSGVTNGIAVTTANAFTPMASLSNSVPSYVKKIMQAAVPHGSSLVNRPSASTPYLTADITGNGQPSYAAVYKNASTHQTGLIVASLRQYQWKVILNQPLGGMMLRELNAGDMTGSGSQDIAVQTYIGDGANAVQVFKWTGGALKQVLNAYGTADIGDFNRDGDIEVAVWTHDTGPLEHIQMYAWNRNTQSFQKAKASDFPQYFASAPVHYYQFIGKVGTKHMQPPKTIDYGLASAYDYAGQYTQSLNAAISALSQGANAYPSDTAVKRVKTAAASARESENTYASAPKTVRSTIQKEITIYSNNLNPLTHLQPQVVQNASGSYTVDVVGTFHRLQNGQMEWAEELHFRVSKSGIKVSSVVGKDAMGNVVWR